MLAYLFTILVLLGSLFCIYRAGLRKANSVTSHKKRQRGEWIPTVFETPRPRAYPDWSIEQTKPLPYRPFKYGPNYFITMGIRNLDFENWIELDNRWTYYHTEKLMRLTGEHESRYCKTSYEAKDAASETMELLCEYLVHRYPSLFEYVENSAQNQIRIKTTGETYPIDSDNPLKYAALLIQDDLALMIEGPDGKYYLKGGAIALSGFWRLEDKFNKSLAEIHTSGNVPQFREKLQISTERFFQNMTASQAVCRFNYFIQPDGELAWSRSLGPENPSEIVSVNVELNPCIEDIHFRAERQTLRRLPRSGGILFTIRTYFEPIVEIAQEPGVPGRLASAIRSWPDDIALYKGIKDYAELVLNYLDEKHSEQCANGIESDHSKLYPY